MQILFNVLSAVCGTAVGILQVWLLSRMLRAFVAKDYASAIFPLMLKTAVYALTFTVCALLFADYLIPLGAGVGGGITIAAFISSAVSIKKNK